jgi:hypothetical protein
MAAVTALEIIQYTRINHRTDLGASNAARRTANQTANDSPGNSARGHPHRTTDYTDSHANS